ncbi:MAG TPA: LPXTG cell wall anchor domain-containing protein [Lacibacter sp.]|nr:LPXTG cell wall anchor domain-containing protein [Lacibacter sp.]HMO88061.1 LPXTG cell wall anchor domain-containing protein [Lacibacter sp.]HMP88045.1 LPXTG cell wall anchor domain-containing protein [Lacibacter sp.]
MKPATCTIVWLLLLQLATAQPVPTVTTDRSTILIGEPVTLTYTLNGAGSGTVVAWLLPDTLSGFEYLATDTGNLFRRIITLTAWDSGVWQAGPVALRYRAPGDRNWTEREFPAPLIHVQFDTTGTGMINSIKPIEEAEGPASFPWHYLLAAGGGLAALAGYLFYRRRRKPALVSSRESGLSPLEEFVQQLEELRKHDWADPAVQRRGLPELSVALRRYLQRCTGQPLLHQTTGDVAHTMQPLLERNLLLQLLQVLRMTDAVSYARYLPGARDSWQLLENTEQLARALHKNHFS